MHDIHQTRMASKQTSSGCLLDFDLRTGKPELSCWPGLDDKPEHAYCDISIAEI